MRVQVIVPVFAALCLGGSGCLPRAKSAPADAKAELPGREVELTPMALTIDDLPRHGAGLAPPLIARALLDAFKRHHIGSVTGFINAAKLQAHPEDRAVLEAWVGAGHPLANHQWSHADLHVVTPEAFIEGIARNEPVLAAFGTPPNPAYFRYPYLREGRTRDDRATVRRYLDAHGYRVAQVTIDPWDWAYGEAFARCLEKNDAAKKSTLRVAFLTEAREKLAWSRAAAKVVLGRPMKHILLLHLGTIDAEAIDDLLSAYEAMGARWISLDEAMTDPAYAQAIERPGGGHFLEQLAEVKGLGLPSTPQPPQDLIAEACR